MGVYTPLWCVTETTLHLSEKWKIITRDAWDNFDNTGKNIFVSWKTKSGIKKVRKEGLPP